MDGTFLGKITSAELELGSRFGPIFDFSFDGGNMVTDSRLQVPPVYKDTFKYTPEQWAEELKDAYAVMYVAMKEAGVTKFSQLKGKPVEITIEGGVIKHWRILTEVL